jgi:hypothetical protein
MRQAGKERRNKTAMIGLPHCKTDESHAPHKFTKMKSGPMTNVIHPTALTFEFCNPLKDGQMCISRASCALTE